MRLIDADALKKHILGFDSRPTYTQALYLKAIDEQPTAYDVDKVVEQLERVSTEEPLTADGVKVGTIKVLVLKHAVEIVKCGLGTGVCEWKYSKEIMDNIEFQVGCNQTPLKSGIVPNNFSYHDFKFCPFCGKKIKNVG